MRPTVSVIVPAYQAQATLGATLTSVFWQTCQPLEVVVCNDGSTDATADILAAYDDRIRIITQPNRGLAAARNAGIAAARGELIATLDADDLIFPDYLRTLVGVLRGSSTDRAYVCGNSVLMTPNAVLPRRHWSTRHPSGSRQRLRTLETNICSVFAVFPRRMWQDLGGYREELRAVEDYDFWTRAIFSGWQALFEDRALALYRLTPSSLSSDPARMRSNEHLMRQKLSEEFRATMTDRERRLLDRSLELDTCDHYLEAAAERLACGKTDEAAHLLALASSLRPSDRSLRLKTTLLRRVPMTGRLYARRERERLRLLARS